MNSCRLLLVCPWFWPKSEPRSLLATAFAKSLSGSGHKVTVVTRRSAGYWPSTFQIGRVDVIRLTQQRKRLMDSVRSIGRRDPWIGELGRWLPANRSQFDFAIVIAGDGEVQSIANLLKRWELKTIVRIEDTSSLDSYGIFDCPNRTVVWTTPFETAGEQGPVYYVADGADGRALSVEDRESLRRALKTAHPMLDVPGAGPLVLCSSPLVKPQGVFELVTAWKRFLQTCPTARLWLVGTGEDGYRLFQHVRELELEHAVIMPGNCDHASDLIGAADAIVLPGRETCSSSQVDFFVDTAIQYRLPVICHSGNRAKVLPGTRLSRVASDIDIDSGNVWDFCEPDKPLASVLGHWNDWRTSLTGTAETLPEPVCDSMREMALRYIELGKTMTE